jgi:hypothetical protein
MRSGLNIFLLIGAIVTNIVVCDINKQIIEQRAVMLGVISACTKRYNSKPRGEFKLDGNLNGMDSPLAGWVTTVVDLAAQISTNEDRPVVHTLVAYRNRQGVHIELGMLALSLIGNRVHVRLITTLLYALSLIMQPTENYEQAKKVLEESQRRIRTAEAARTLAATADTRDVPACFKGQSPEKRFEYDSDCDEFLGCIPFGSCIPL